MAQAFHTTLFLEYEKHLAISYCDMRGSHGRPRHTHDLNVMDRTEGVTEIGDRHIP